MSTPAPDPDDQTPPNIPPFITPPPTNTRTRIPQVTQTQTPENESNNESTLTPYEEDPDNYIHYHDPDLVLQTPVREKRQTSVPVAPIVYSPERAKINAMEEITKLSASTNKKRQAGTKSMEKMQKRQKTVVNNSAKNNIFHFIRKKSIDAMESDFPEIKMSKFDTMIRSANSHWSGSAKKDLVFDPFEDEMESALLNSSNLLLTHEHHRLLLEEMMLLPAGSVFTCAVRSTHYLLKQSRSTSLIKKCITSFPTRPLILDRNIYFTFNLVVRSNPKLEEFTYGTMGSREAIMYECTKHGGCGLNCEFEATGDHLLVKFHNLIDHPRDIMFWSSTHSLTRSTHIKKKLREIRDPRRLCIVAMRYLDEFYGDAVPTITIISHVRSFMKAKEQSVVDKVVKNAEVSTEKLVDSLNLKASDPIFERFRNVVDDTCLQALDALYGEFAGFTSPILSQRQLSVLSDLFKSTLPRWYHAVASLLNKNGKENVKRFSHLQGQWDRDILYQFFTICRKRNSQFFSYWALINTASSYGGTNLDLQVFFGLAVTVSTMLKKLNSRYPFQMIMRKTMKTLASIKDVGICVFDNSQMIRSLKFQRGGKSSEFSLATSRLFLRAQIPNLISLFQWPQEKVPLTYVDQRIPSPPGMAMYETIERITPSTFKGETVCSSQMDLTGNRVNAWASLAMLSSQIYKLQRLLKTKDNERFQFQHNDNIQSMTRLHINSRLRKNRSGFYTLVKNFQYNETLKWRGKPESAHVIIPPASPHDETTNAGAAKVILSLLVMFGILKKSDSLNDEDEIDLKNLILAENAKERYLIMVGDGLTQIRAKQFAEMIDETSTSYGPRHRITSMLQKALEQVIFVPGDLHGGGFHIMQAVYNLFYGSLLQKIQSILKWKRICGSDVSKCYQQSTSLASIAAVEVERHLLSEHCRSIHENQSKRRLFNMIENPEELAIHVAESYSAWIEDRRRLTTDEVFRMILNFVTVMNLYRLFRVGVRMGDAIIIEWTYREMLSIFYATGKKHYYEIDLKQMEDLYNRIPYKYLHLVRINRTVPLYSGKDRQGNPMGNWALDGLIETVQKYYHKMNFHTGKSNGWLKHSPHVMLMSKASRIVMEEYSRLQSNEDKDLRYVDHADTNIQSGKGANSVKNSSNPKRERESCAVAEYLLVTKMTRETPNRKYNDDELWRAMDKCTVELISESERSRAERMVQECQTEEEILLDKFTDSLYNHAEGVQITGDDDGESNSIVNLVDPENDDEESLEYEMDPSVMADSNDLAVNEGDEAGLENVTIDEERAEINVRGFGNVKKASINPLAINHDIIRYAKGEVEKLNLKEVRVRRKDRKERMKSLSNDVMAEISHHRERGSADIESSVPEEQNHIVQSLLRHEEAVMTNGVDN